MGFEQKEIDEHQEACNKIRKTLQKGQWMNEKDRVQFEHNGLDCLLVRNPSSFNWCAYVGVPETHEAFNQDYDHDHLTNLSVHGGLTY